MSYGIIRAWKGASEHERMKEFLTAAIQTNTEYLENNCTSDVEFIDVSDNQKFNGIVATVDHLKAKWSLGAGNFEISEIEMSYTDKSELATFILTTKDQSIVGLVVVEEKNGRISLCKLALKHPL